MKKTSKKVVSLLTILSFLLTLVPAAAFAGDPAPTVADAQASFVSIKDAKDAETEVSVGEKVTAVVNVLDKERNATTNLGGKKLVIWAEETTDQVSTAAEPVVLDAVTTSEVEKDLTFVRSGNYTIKAALVADYKADAFSPKQTKDNGLQLKGDKVKVAVSAKNVDATKAVINKKELPVGDSYTADTLTVLSNGIDNKEIKVTVQDKDGKNVGKGKEVRFETNSSNLILSTSKETTDYAGAVSAKVSGTVDGDYKVYVTIDDVEFIVPVTVGAQNAADIEVVRTTEKPIATNEDFSSLEDFVRLQVKDINGNILSGDLSVKEKGSEKAFAAAKSSKDVEDHVKVLDKPTASKVKADDFKLIPVKNDKDEYTNDYTVAVNKDLVAGKYSVKFFLNNGRSAVVNFEVAKFGTAKQLLVEYDTETVELATVGVKAPSVVFVDENGVQKKAGNRVTLGYSGYAVQNFKKDGSFDVKGDEKYLGSKITVTAVAEREGLVAKADLTVAQDGRNIKFLGNKGVVGANNKVDFQLVDADGKTVALAGGYGTSAIIAQKVSDETAKVSAAVTGTADLATKGLGTLSLTSDKPVTVDFAVYVRSDKGVYYAGNLKYTFGKTASKADTTVVMTIGSKDVIVDNNITAIDTAALIKNDRTFVPYRALAEAFGAKVEWNEKDRTVTTEMDGKKVVMTIDKKEYKVNDKEMTMDVAPYIANDRTLVPVRFVAEALGFKVTPTYNTDGTTASVVFNK